MNRRPLSLLVTASLLAVIWGLAWIDYRAHTAEHRDQFDQLGAALVGASESVVLRMCRGGRYDPAELSAAVEALRVGVGAAGLSITSDEIGSIAEASASPDERHGKTRAFLSRFETPQPRGQGRHGPGPTGLVELPSGTLGLELLLSMNELEARLAGDLRRFLGLALSLSVALVLFLVLLAARERSVVLAQELGSTQEKLRGLEFLRRLGAGLAHETRNPLGILRGFAQELADGEVPPERVQAVATTIVEEADRTVTRLDEFMLLSRPSELRRERFELHELLDELGGLIAPDLENVQATLELEPFRVEVEADREQTRRLFLNLLLNAAQALNQGGTIRIRARDLGDSVELRIEDDGPGVPIELQETLFEPYVSRHERGTGLGLAIVRRIANEHGWRVFHEALEPHGAGFVVQVSRP